MINCSLVCNLFSCLTAPFTEKTIVKFIKLSNDGNLKLHFTNQPLSKFWINVQNAYSTLAREALKKLMPFATAGFLQYVSTIKLSTKANWMPKCICIFSCQVLHQTLEVFPFLCKLTL